MHHELQNRPLYLQVRDAMSARIAAGEWVPGSMIPNEGKLATEYGVSPGTMRKALSLMGGEFTVVRRQGRGTYVTDQAARTRPAVNIRELRRIARKLGDNDRECIEAAADELDRFRNLRNDS